MPTQRLTIYLLREVTEPKEALQEEAVRGLSSYELTQESDLTGHFYYKRSFTSPPGWAKYIDPVVDGTLDDLKTATASGLLVITVDQNTFALTFGYGRSFLNQAKIERRFGLRVALNLIDERQLRSLDTKKFDEMVVSTNTQTSRTTELPVFGVDVLRDILGAVTGVAPPTSGYKSLTGSDALVLGVAEPAIELPSLLRDLYKHYTATKYQSAFGWIDHLSEVKDPNLICNLVDQLVDQLRESETNSTHMAMPENLDWEDIEHFLIAPARQHHFPELDLDAYLAHRLVDPKEITVDKLKRRGVSVKFLRNTEEDARWSLYRCLISEQRFDGTLYALIEGRWFSIADSLVSQVNAAVAAIPQSTVALPAARSGESEASYNARAASTIPELTLLDKHLVAPAGANSRIEFCDLISTDGSLVHVKRKSRSSTLSHLFAQGHVSAETLVDETLREQVRVAITTAAGNHDCSKWLALVPPGTSPLERDKLTITYAVITNSKAEGAQWLPFFSRLTLMQAVRDLNRLGFMKVALVRVPLTMEETPSAHKISP